MTVDGCSSNSGMEQVWEEYVAQTHIHRDVEGALKLMTEDAAILYLPVLTGARGKPQLRDFLSHDFMGRMPSDIRVTRRSTVVNEADEQLIEENLLLFTHSTVMPWMLPSLAPTQRRVELLVVHIVSFREEKIKSVRSYWDHEVLLQQLDSTVVPTHHHRSALDQLIEYTKST
eukprot:GILK01012844.1.p1 GENE.GILK01012844.1~~GILK01012844.1.p1  ORF type:complete len:173 (+),score=30.23 GILK01012844.1:1-519(+)